MTTAIKISWKSIFSIWSLGTTDKTHKKDKSGKIENKTREERGKVTDETEQTKQNRKTRIEMQTWTSLVGVTGRYDQDSDWYRTTLVPTGTVRYRLLALPAGFPRLVPNDTSVKKTQTNYIIDVLPGPGGKESAL